MTELASRKIVIDPLTRIEGHLRVDLEVADGVVKSAWSSGTSFRGLEGVLVGRAAREAAQITQRVCGVCPIPHARAASAAVERAAGFVVNDQARLLRNLVLAANFIDSHLVHFYLLSLPDWVAGLPTAGGWPKGRAPRAWRGGEGLDVARLVEHSLSALKAQRACRALHALFGGKFPHAPGIIPGGATARPTAPEVETAHGLAREIRNFVNGPFGEDVQGLAAAFPQYRELGASRSDLLSFGGFPEADGKLLFPAGLLLTTDPPGTTARAPEQASVLESVASSRYRPGSPRHPADGQTIPDLTRQDAYSFVKGVKLDGRFCEVGPLARSIVAGRGPGGRGVWARYLARVAEASLLAAAIERWLGELRVEESACPSFPTPTVSGQGYSVIEAPRGVLGHWVTLEGGLIQRYHIISPTTWNASPRDEAGVPGPIERALEGVPIADTADPIEAVRVVHSFDPCLQCAVH